MKLQSPLPSQSAFAFSQNVFAIVQSASYRRPGRS
jgi:hypothetical protein